MTSDLVRKIRSFFSRQKGIVAVFLFGSYAKGGQTRGSDVDVAVLYEQGHIPDFRLQMDIKEELGKILNAAVDLVILNRANPVLKHQIFKYGEKVLENDPRESTNFLVKSMFQYDDLKRIRAPIEKSILKGRIYG